MPRLAIEAQGVVQGVGMRPFVHSVAARHRLVGWVQNAPGTVRIEVQGDRESLRSFVRTLEKDCPSPAGIHGIEVREVDEREETSFRILDSASGLGAGPTLAADLAVCTGCAAETETRGTRRFRYPFTNCARCGPRFTIVESLPYDRERTSMKGFAMCADCAAEYHCPSDRRFHAQPIACPACGPRLSLLSADGLPIARGDEALCQAALAVRSGRILALKGIGGFQLVVDATSSDAVARLRARKHRDAKPLAVMFPSLDAVRRSCKLSSDEERALVSPAAPIVLLRQQGAGFADEVAPDNPRLGAMLPYSPLHRLLLGEIDRPIVCTSGNLSDEPMCVTEEEALGRLASVADVFLVHDRPVARPADDSVARVGPHGLSLLRRARGWAPLPVRLSEPTPVVLALGAHLKNTVALAIRGSVIVSQHLGDLHSAEAAARMACTARELLRFYDVQPELVACDAHPDYASTRFAEEIASAYGVPLERVQHHHAHVAACVAEHALHGTVLGVAWDGSGLGEDGTLWGGEFFRCEGPRARRVAHLRAFPLPGGERAMREPARAALGLVHEMTGGHAESYGCAWFGPQPARVLGTMLARSLNCPRTSSVGRLFDAVSALTGLRTKSRYEAEAAMALEFAADGVGDVEPYPVALRGGNPLVADWEPLVRAVLEDCRRGVPVARISACFHESLAALIEAVAVRAEVPSVVLSGGCFQNERLVTRTRERLERRGFGVHTPRQFPANDGGISLGQVLVASRRFFERSTSCA